MLKRLCIIATIASVLPLIGAFAAEEAGDKGCCVEKCCMKCRERPCCRIEYRCKPCSQPTCESRCNCMHNMPEPYYVPECCRCCDGEKCDKCCEQKCCKPKCEPCCKQRCCKPKCEPCCKQKCCEPSCKKRKCCEPECKPCFEPRCKCKCCPPKYYPWDHRH